MSRSPSQTVSLDQYALCLPGTCSAQHSRLQCFRSGEVCPDDQRDGGGGYYGEKSPSSMARVIWKSADNYLQEYNRKITRQAHYEAFLH